MLNADIYQQDPQKRVLLNKGVANVNDDKSREAMDVLRYELETFVCEGRYADGLERVLESFLRNIGRSDQPGVWVSGFYGSGKSHFVKMLRALWSNIKFDDGAEARGIPDLPTGVRDSLKELSLQGKRHGGLHAASGTLGSAKSGSVRLAIMSIVFKSAGLPENWKQAQFALWLKNEQIYDAVRDHVEQKGRDWELELINFAVSDPILEKLVELRPRIFPDAARCGEALENQFLEVEDVSSADMVRTIEQALSRDGKFPLCLIVLDEVQQFIGSDNQKAMDIQEAVETCSKSFGGKLLFVGTGQTGITATRDLKKIQGRFTLRVELSDADVDFVIRKVILAKKPAAIKELEETFQANRGEISRHLSTTALHHRQEDEEVFSQDYPLLPTRRRLWDNILRVMDKSGTDSQLRNQLSMAHKVIQTNLDKELGHVIGADHIYFDSADKLLQTGILPRNVHQRTMILAKGNEEQRLLARAVGLIFLLNKLRANADLKIRVDVDTLADLLVEDLNNGSAGLRGELPGLLDACDLVMTVNNGTAFREYRIQTPESSAWRDEYRSRLASLANNPHIVAEMREQRLQDSFKTVVGKLAVAQGKSRIMRSAEIIFDGQLPPDTDKKIYVCARDGWNESESSLKSEAIQAGAQSPAIFVFLPKSHENQLRDNILKFSAARETLDARGTPSTPEGMEAKASIEHIKSNAEAAINQALEQIMASAIVFQGGGQQISGDNPRAMVLEALESSLLRLYPQFGKADNPGWSSVYEKARKGDGDALQAVGDKGEAAHNPVCKEILSVIGSGKTGSEIRKHFESAPFGWPGDAVDGALQILLVAGLVKALDERGKDIAPTTLERGGIGKTTFRIQAVTINAAQRLAIRKLYNRAATSFTPDKEAESADDFLRKMLNLAAESGGDAPKPQRPDTALLEQIREESGNEQLKAIYDNAAHLTALLDQWTATAGKVAQRWPRWLQLEQMAKFSADTPEAASLLRQMEDIKAQRQLLAEPDPANHLMGEFAGILRDKLNVLQKAYQQNHAAGMERLRNNENWEKLRPEQKNEILAENKLSAKFQPVIKVGNVDEILDTLNRHSLGMLEDSNAALQHRFGEVEKDAAAIFEPQIRYIALPRRVLKTEADVSGWLAEVEEQLKTAVADGPVMAR